MGAGYVKRCGIYNVCHVGVLPKQLGAAAYRGEPVTDREQTPDPVLEKARMRLLALIDAPQPRDKESRFQSERGYFAGRGHSLWYSLRKKV